MSIHVAPCNGALGAEISNIDRNEPIDAATGKALRQTWAEHLILVLRGQPLRDAALAQFTRQSGRCDKSPPNETALKPPGYVPRLPEAAVISNVRENASHPPARRRPVSPGSRIRLTQSRHKTHRVRIKLA